MYTLESDFKVMQAAAKEAGIPLKNMKKAALVEALNALQPAPAVVEKTGKRGRPINPNSPRQIRLSQVQTGKRGRPANPESAWNKRQKELEAKRAAGDLKLGRAVNPNSARQLRIAEIAARKANGTYKLGRPAQAKPEVAAATPEVPAETQA